ncbi:universal stress protein [Secundilactobacillus malefermentans]|uniref:UspA domain-containing protein n=1 Tax=Secundilactobacillus malefermentans TaxID=176292 RepID=A0A4R5NP95_9LACO|nr:universal stress protein [Secundilactobacillus malefermentans]KRM57940.1 UspA domain-containing protein [Secundilactobacillus malefermentans DSM 5705 = KCTC 3548]QEA31183.1 universal stress protein [Secundilactobacillus malefermentans]TDG78460.1 hypothetical protein C5L31_001076 [Secundilactobacillus malefermentans]
MYEKLLVPLDGSENASAALSEAIDLAKHFSSTLVLVSVANDQSYTQYGAIFGQDIIEHMREDAEKILSAAETKVKSAGVNVETHFVVGIPKQAIADSLPETYGTTLTVIGKSGVHGLNRAIMGSTTAYVISHSSTNVMVVNEPN